jgi:hypothetical protein
MKVFLKINYNKQVMNTIEYKFFLIFLEKLIFLMFFGPMLPFNFPHRGVFRLETELLKKCLLFHYMGENHSKD